jgi:hypothetical protein
MAGLSEHVSVDGYQGLHGGETLGSLPFSGHYIVLALAAIALISVLLWIPVLSDKLTGALSATAPIWAPIMLLSGGALLTIGMLAHVTPLDIAGGSLIGFVVLAFLVDNY